MKKIAIIDQDTSSTKLHIFEVLDTGIKEVFRKKIETRLGDNMGSNGGVIEKESLQRAVKTLNELKELCLSQETDSVEVVSTEVLRKAVNAEEAQSTLRRETGLLLRVLTQEEESQMFFSGVTADLEWDGKIAAIDIGGGSVQFMCGTKGRLERHELLKTGALFLRNLFFKEDTPTEEEYARLEKSVEQAISHIDYKLPPDTPLIHGSTSVLNFYKEGGNSYDFLFLFC